MVHLYLLSNFVALLAASSLSARPVTSAKLIDNKDAIKAAVMIGNAENYLIDQLSTQTNLASALVKTPRSNVVIKILPSPISTATISLRPTAARSRTSIISSGVTTATTISKSTPANFLSSSSNTLATSIPLSNSNLKIDLTPLTADSQTFSSTACTSTDPIKCEFQSDTLKSHNAARKIHHAEPLVWNTLLAEAASLWAQECKWEHSGGSLFPSSFVYGENLYSSSSSEEGIVEAVQAFMDEESLYDYKKAKYSDEVGHFTQVVWKSSKFVGCSKINCDLSIFSQYTNSSTYIVCIYHNSGNWIGEFAANVEAP